MSCSQFWNIERDKKKKEREIQRKGESRRQAIEAQRGKERQRAGARDKKQRTHYFIYTSHHFTPHGRYELNKLTSLPMCGFIAQLVEQRTGNAEVTGWNPVEALVFFLLFVLFLIAYIGKFTAMIILHFH